MINLFNFIEFITSNLVLNSTDIRDNELFFLIFCFIVLISFILIFFMFSWITSLNLKELFSWTKVLSFKTSFLFAIQLLFLMIFKLNFSVSCSWYYLTVTTYHHTSFLFSILYEVSLFFWKIRTYFLKLKSSNQYLHLCFIIKRLWMTSWLINSKNIHFWEKMLIWLSLSLMYSFYLHWIIFIQELFVSRF